MAKAPFSEEQFTDTDYSTAREKALFANRLVRFVEVGMPIERFTPALYRRLMYLFGHIAHFNCGGFAQNWFSTTLDKLHFLENIVLNAHHYGDWADVEMALRDLVIERGLIEVWVHKVHAEVEAAERSELARLLAKYGVPATV